MHYEIFVTVWEERFVKKFLNFALASQLAPGNLPGLAAVADVTYRIYTNRSSERYFYPQVAVLERLVRVEFVYYEDLIYRGGTLAEAIENSDVAIVKHNIQRHTSLDHMFRALKKHNVAVILLDSDFIFSDGSFLHIHKQRITGKRGYAAMFLRLLEDEAAPILSKYLPKSLTGRELVRIGLNHMHPISNSMFMDAERPSSYPVQNNWRVDGQGFVTVCLFPHPLMFELNSKSINYLSTMDYDLLLRAVSIDDDIYLCQSSDDLMFCKMSSSSYGTDVGVGVPPTIASMAQFIIANTNKRHALFMKKPIRYVASEDQDSFLRIEREATMYVEAIYKAAQLVLSENSTSDPRILLMMKSFLGPIEDFVSPQIRSRLGKFLPK